MSVDTEGKDRSSGPFLRFRDLAQCWREGSEVKNMDSFLPEDLCSVLSIHACQLTTACHSRSRASNSLTKPPLTTAHTVTDIPESIHTNKSAFCCSIAVKRHHGNQGNYYKRQYLTEDLLTFQSVSPSPGQET